MLVVLSIQAPGEPDRPVRALLRESGFALAVASSPTEISERLRPDAVVFGPQVDVQARLAVIGRVGDVLELVDEGEDGAILQALIAHAARSRPPIQLGTVALDLRSRTVLRGDTARTLTHREAALFAWLLSRTGQVVSRAELLINVWGYSADMVTRTVDITIGRLREKIEENPRSPQFILTLRGKGYRLELPEQPAAAPADPPTQPVSEASGLFGREEATARLLGELQPGRLITLHGPGGVGKTVLAQRLLASRAEAGDVWVDLVSVTGAEVLSTIARALAVPAAHATAETLGRALAHKGTALLVLDNTEHVQAAVRDLVGTVQSMAPGLCILATSRTRLRAAVEVVFTLGPLSPEPACALFLARARARAPGYARDAEPALLRDIVSAVDALPLAIELAAARAPLLAPQKLLERLAASTGWLRDRRASPRRTTLARTVAWSWDLLDDDEQRALSVLSVFRGGANMDALEAVLGGAPGEAADLVDGLLDANLLWHAGGRVRLYVGVQEYAAEQLEAQGEGAAAVAAHEAFYADLAVQASAALYGPRCGEARATLAAERGNLHRALVAGHDRAGDLALGLLNDVEYSNARFIDEPVLESAAGRALAPLQRSRLLRVWFARTRIWGENDKGDALRAQLEALLPQLPADEQAWVGVSFLIGLAQQRDRAAAEPWMARIEALAPGTTPQRLQAHLCMGNLYRRDADTRLSAHHSATAVSLASALGSDLMQAFGYLIQVFSLRNAGRMEMALAQCRRAIALYRKYDAMVSLQVAETFLAATLLYAQRPAEALDTLDRLLASAAVWGAPGQLNNFRILRSWCLRLLRRFEDAIADSLAVLQPLPGGLPPQTRHAHGAYKNLIFCWLELGEYAEAERVLAGLMAQEGADSLRFAKRLAVRLALLRGDPAGALQHLSPPPESCSGLLLHGIACVLSGADGRPDLTAILQHPERDGDEACAAHLWLALLAHRDGDTAAARTSLAAAAREEGVSLEVAALQVVVAAVVDGAPDWEGEAAAWALCRLARCAIEPGYSP